MQSWKSSWKKLIQQQIEQKRIEEARLEKKRQEVEEKTRIAKIKAEAFACRRCSIKFSNNTKLHEHIRDHHAKKSKFAVSNSTISSFTSSSTSSHSTIFLFDTSNQIFTSTTSSQSIVILSFISSSSSSQSIIVLSYFSSNISSSVSSNRSFLSNSASEFVFRRSESASSAFSQKFVAMRLTHFFKSIFEIFTKFYLIIIDLYIMFVEKFMRAKLFSSQNSSFSSDVFASYQTRIIAYFLLVKSTKFKFFTSVHDSIKQSIRVSSSRFSFFSFRSFSSIRFLFSTSLYFSFVCWRCQESFVICLFRNWIDSIAARVETSVRRRERRLFL